ncbi:tetratricopeptide repeat protein [Caviibacter abscessus]|uniref:tetratricopeptide repeat protein n=1 Tax=Caviibacter abscessus TaxID=1766719 RepID=UPI00083778D8|nr:hypothetical protein [Caviibacter abscessus]
MLKTLIFREFRYNGDIEDCIKKLEKNIENDANDIDSLKQLANIYHAYKQNSKAIEIYEKLSEDMPNDHEIMAFLGYLYYENDNLELSKACLRRALELSSKEPFVLFLLGNISSRRGMIIDAINYYDRAIFLDFDIITAHVDFGRKYEHMGRHEKAYKEYLAAYKLDPQAEDIKEKLEYIKTKF